MHWALKSQLINHLMNPPFLQYLSQSPATEEDILGLGNLQASSSDTVRFKQEPKTDTNLCWKSWQLLIFLDVQ